MEGGGRREEKHYRVTFWFLFSFAPLPASPAGFALCGCGLATDCLLPTITSRGPKEVSTTRRRRRIAVVKLRVVSWVVDRKGEKIFPYAHVPCLCGLFLGPLHPKSVLRQHCCSQTLGGRAGRKATQARVSGEVANLLFVPLPTADLEHTTTFDRTTLQLSSEKPSASGSRSCEG